jgi:hypothetical protein
MQDGADINQKDTRSCKVDICEFVKKYMITPPKFLNSIPESHIQVQKKFYRRSFTELLDKCSYSILKSKDKEEVELKEMFHVMWTPQG